MKRIVLIEDNVDLAFGLRNNLEIEGYAVEVCHDGTSGLATARAEHPDLVILDLMLPGLDGLRVLRALKDNGLRMPVLVLTAKGDEVDKVRALKLGADDYVTKPFGLLELLARVEVRLRAGDSQSVGQGHDDLLRFGDVEIHPSSRVVVRGGTRVELTPKEYDLLVALHRRDGAVVTRLELMREVWGYSDAVISRTVDSHVAELRRKLEANPGQPRFILTVRKVGYRLEIARSGV
jgi:DNA-binding response OmpR family regulator